LSQFTSVNKQWMGEGAVFGMLPQIESEARNVVAGLLPLMRFLCGNVVQKVFKPDAWIIHLSSKWDPLTRTVRTADDDRIEAIGEVDPEYLCKQDLTTFSIISPPSLLRPETQDLFQGETDSVSTLNTKGLKQGTYRDILQKSAMGPTADLGDGTPTAKPSVASVTPSSSFMPKLQTTVSEKTKIVQESTTSATLNPGDGRKQASRSL